MTFTLTVSQIEAAVQAVPQLYNDGVSAWVAGFSNPETDIAMIEDLAALASIIFPEIGPAVSLLPILLAGAQFAIENPGVGANEGVQSLGKIGAR